MNILWVFFIIIFFCIYVFLGLHITDGIESLVQLILAWVIYTIMWTTFLNIFLLGYFWSVIKNKKGPSGLRGPSGEHGSVGMEGSCSIESVELALMKSLTEYIDSLYHSKNNTHIVNSNYKFKNKFLNTKIGQTAGSRQYRILVANLSADNKPVDNLINYLKNIWSQWFDLLYNATSVPGSWFQDEFGDEIDNYGWLGDNPFIEIRKYDVYYWGITRSFRPLKAEICRSTVNHADSKLPKPHILQTKDTQTEPRLKVITSNDYYALRGWGTSSGDTHTPYANFWSPNSQTIDKVTYYPVGDIINPGLSGNKKGDTIIKDVHSTKLTKEGVKIDNGPDMKTILVSGDVVNPIGYERRRYTASSGPSMNISVAICPKGYKALGYFVNSDEHNFNKDAKCVPDECVEVTSPPDSGKKVWYKTHDYFDWSWEPGWEHKWDYDVNALSVPEENPEPDYKNSYNFFGLPTDIKPYYKLKKTCLEKIPSVDFPIEPKYNKPPPSTKDVESEYSDLGIGWYGHPYKLDPKYSIFTYLNLVPEGMIVNKGTGDRFYIIHNEGNTINLFNILTYNVKTSKYDGSLQALDYNKNGSGFKVEPVVVYDDYIPPAIVDQHESTLNQVVNLGPIRITTPNMTLPNSNPFAGLTNPADIVKKLEEIKTNGTQPNTTSYNTLLSNTPPPKRIAITKLDTTKINQQWKIILDPQDKKKFQLKNIDKNTYLFINQEPREGIIDFTTIDLDNNNYKNDPAFSDISQEEINNRTTFSFIPSFGTHLNVIDDNP